MKKNIFYVIVLLLAYSCTMYMPPGITAQTTAEKYLDSLYRPDTIRPKIGMGYITLKDFAIAVKRTEFQKDSSLNNVSTISWADFTKKTNEIVTKHKDLGTGSIVILSYQFQSKEHTTAFFVDGWEKKVIDTIQMK